MTAARDACSKVSTGQHLEQIIIAMLLIGASLERVVGKWEAVPHQQSLFHCCFISCTLTFFLTSSCRSFSLLIAQRTHTQRLKVSKRHLRHSQHSRHTVIYLIYTRLFELACFTLSHSLWVCWRT